LLQCRCIFGCDASLKTSTAAAAAASSAASAAATAAASANASWGTSQHHYCRVCLVRVPQELLLAQIDAKLQFYLAFRNNLKFCCNIEFFRYRRTIIQLFHMKVVAEMWLFRNSSLTFL
jgi:hypothetical protein